MIFLVDTNVLLRSAHPIHPLHPIATRAVDDLIKNGNSLVVAPQNMAGFWNVATRPFKKNGLGMTVENAASELARLESVFLVLAETENAYREWKSLVTTYRVLGVKTHDARLVAIMRANGITKILTFNTDDFTRYPGIEAIHPGELA
jgi:predicted nucleic acid-binding protein